MSEQSPSVIALPTLDVFVSDQWEKTRGITSPRFSTVQDLYPRQEFQVLILLGEYTIKDRKLRIKVSCQIEDAQGNASFPAPFERILEADLEKEIGLILLPDLPRFSFSSAHPAGEYQVVVTTFDFNSEEEETVRYAVELHHQSPSSFPDLEGKLEAWKQNYYLDPKPNELVAAYFQSMKDIGINNDANILFYVEALNNALFLVPDINRILLEGEISRMERNALIMLAARCKSENVDLEGFWKEELAILHDIRDEGTYNPLYVDEITHPSELDMLWSLFFANGKYENIKKIISALPFQFGIGEEDFPKLSEKEQLQFAIGAAAAWSLEAVGSDHKLLRVYMIHFINREEASEELRNSLISILQKIDAAQEEA